MHLINIHSLFSKNINKQNNKNKTLDQKTVFLLASHWKENCTHCLQMYEQNQSVTVFIDTLPYHH